jgi:hypothetical protein
MPKPILQSLILADHVYEDKLTGKRIIAGVFNRIIRGVRVFKDVPPSAPPQSPPQQLPPQQYPAQQQVPAPQQYPTYPEVPAQPPAYAPQTEIVAPAPFTPPEPAAQPPQWQPPPPTPQASPPSPPAAPAQAPASAPPVSPAAAPTYQPPPAAASPPPVPHPTTPAAEQPPAAHPQPVARPTPPTPPPPPAQPPLQPGQRVLEIPPTGFQSGSPFAYLSLTEVRGVTPLTLQLMNLQDDTQLFRSDLRVDCPNPLYTVEITVPLPPITPPQAGIYALEVMYNNEILGSLRIVVEDAPQ